MQLAAGLVITGLGAIFAYGWACRLLPRGRRHRLDLALVTLGLSIGGLTLWMFWIALVLPGRLNLATAMAGPIVFGGLGFWASWHDWTPDAVEVRNSKRSLAMDRVLLGLVGLTAAAILFNSVYWPFSEEDALAIYAPLAKRIYRTGALPGNTGLYFESYPMLVPLAYAYTHWALGAVNEYLARLIPGLLAAGALGATAALGRELHSARAGWLAAALLGLTPSFCRWASSGYADIPASFYFTLSALLAWRWCRGGKAEDGMLAGATAGLALWTKNSALTLCVTLPALLILRSWTGRTAARERTDKPLPWRQIALFSASVLAVAGPWYVRNLVLFDFLVPDVSYWTNQARHDLMTLMAMTKWSSWGLSGWLFTVSIVFGSVAALRRGRQLDQWVLLLIYALPFCAAWWWMANYDPRLLMVVTPVLAVMAALMLETVAGVVKTRVPVAWRPGITLAMTLILLAMAFFSLRQAVQHKPVIASRPWSTDEEKHGVCLGGLYDLAKAVNQLPSGSRVAGVPAMSRYHIDLDRLTVLPDVRCDVRPEMLSVDCDYVVYKFPGDERPDWALEQRWLFHSPDGYWLCTKSGERSR